VVVHALSQDKSLNKQKRAFLLLHIQTSHLKTQRTLQKMENIQEV